MNSGSSLASRACSCNRATSSCSPAARSWRSRLARCCRSSAALPVLARTVPRIWPRSVASTSIRSAAARVSARVPASTSASIAGIRSVRWLQHGTQHAREHVLLVGRVGLQDLEEPVRLPHVDLAVDVVAQRALQDRVDAALVEQQEHEVTLGDEATGDVQQVEGAGVGLAPVRLVAHRALDQQHHVDLVLQAVDVMRLGAHRDLAEAGQVDHGQLLDPGVREGALDAQVAHGQVTPGHRGGPAELVVGRVGDVGAQLVEGDLTLAADQVGQVAGQRGLHVAQPLEQGGVAGLLGPARRRPGGRVLPAGELLGRGGQPGQPELGVVRGQHVGHEGVERVQPQGGPLVVRGVEDPAAHGGDRQPLAGRDLPVVQAGDALQQRALAHPGLPAHPDVDRGPGEPGLQHAQQPHRVGHPFAGLLDPEPGERVAQLGGRGRMVAELVHGGGQPGQLVVHPQPPLDLRADLRDAAPAVVEDGLDAGRHVVGRGCARRRRVVELGHYGPPGSTDGGCRRTVPSGADTLKYGQDRGSGVGAAAEQCPGRVR